MNVRCGLFPSPRGKAGPPHGSHPAAKHPTPGQGGQPACGAGDGMGSGDQGHGVWEERWRREVKQWKISFLPRRSLNWSLSTKGYKDGEGTGTSTLRGESEGAVLVQPEEEKAERGPNKCL